jgi:hypothetical protein
MIAFIIVPLVVLGRGPSSKTIGQNKERHAAICWRVRLISDVI